MLLIPYNDGLYKKNCWEISASTAGFGLKYKGSRDSGTSGSHGSRSHSLLIFQTESGRGSTHLLEFSLIPPIIIYPGEYEKWWCEKFLVKVASLMHTNHNYKSICLLIKYFLISTLTLCMHIIVELSQLISKQF